MVRLGGGKFTASEIHKLSFNSSMVRLGDSNGKKSRRWSRFQFQYGSIGRQEQAMAKAAFDGFNSSMVRLGELIPAQMVSP